MTNEDKIMKFVIDVKKMMKGFILDINIIKII